MMKCNPGQLKLFVKSQNVPIGFAEFSRPTASGLLAFSRQSTRVVVYGRILDETQTRLVEDARKLSEKSGLCLEVVDLGKQSLLRRAVSRIFHGEGMLSHQGIHLEVKSLSDLETAFNSSIR